MNTSVKTLFKTTLVAGSVAIACGSALAAPTADIVFDRDGAGGSDPIVISLFDWLPGNGLSINALSLANTSPPDPVTGLGGGTSFNTVAQGTLGVFKWDSGGGSIAYLPIAGTEFTVEVSFWEYATGIGTAAAAFFLDLSKPATFSIYYDTSADSNDITGTGYNDGLVILSGTVSGLTGAYTDFTRLGEALIPNPFPVVGIDQFGANNAGDVGTHQGNGSTTLQIDVTYQDTNFFLSDIDELLVDAVDTTNAADPFITANPSDLVLGNTPRYSPVAWSGGLSTNGVSCVGLAGDPACDFHFQTDASTAFIPTTQVPEPGSLMLLSAGLLGLGWRWRRKGA